MTREFHRLLELKKEGKLAFYHHAVMLSFFAGLSTSSLEIEDCFDIIILLILAVRSRLMLTNHFCFALCDCDKSLMSIAQGKASL